MIEESKTFANQCLWFSALVSKKDTLEPLIRALEKAKVADYKIVEMAVFVPEGSWWIEIDALNATFIRCGIVG